MKKEKRNLPFCIKISRLINFIILIKTHKWHSDFELYYVLIKIIYEMLTYYFKKNHN